MADIWASNTASEDFDGSWKPLDSGWAFHASSGVYCYLPSGEYYFYDEKTQLYTPCHDATVAIPKPQMSHEAGAAFMQGRRPKQEDRHILIPDFNGLIEFKDQKLPFNPCSFYALFDGHVGSRASEFCESKFSSILADCLSKLTVWKEFTDTPPHPSSNGTASRNPQDARWQKIKDAVIDAFNKVDETFLNKYRVSRDGCTALMTLVLGDNLVVASVGDSRAVLGWKQKRDDEGSSQSSILAETTDFVWRAERLTKDHKPGDPEEKSRIIAQGGKIVNTGGTNRVAPKDYEERCKRIRLAQCRVGGTPERAPVALAERCLQFHVPSVIGN
eukprot:GHVL01010311.1.p2 GENE.GHVL01010311.1~~GHVL01010311.1.p2  ORF type:complete len:330 (-),score=51.17 GHVL01010311.1:2358-3347(-)